MSCCARGQRKHHAAIDLTQAVKDCLRETKFGLQQIRDMSERFFIFTHGTAYMTKEDFRGMMGIADSSSSTMILDRIFESISVRSDGISFLEFARYVDILFNGDQAAKAHLSFRMIDSKKRGFLTIQDFTSLILTAIITTHGIRGGRKTDFGSKASAMAECIFAKFHKTKDDTVSMSEFAAAVEEDPSLLEIFTLLSKGVTESIVQPNEEDAQLKWYHGQAKFIYLCAKGILKDFLEQNGFIRTASPHDPLKFTSDFNRDLRINQLSSSWYKPTNEKHNLDDPNQERKLRSDFMGENPFKITRSDFKPESLTAREARKGFGLNNIGISESDVRQTPNVDQFSVSNILPDENPHFTMMRNIPDRVLGPKRAISNPAGEKRGSISVGAREHKTLKPVQLLHDNTDFLMRELEDKLDPFIVKDRVVIDYKMDTNMLPKQLPTPVKHANGKDSMKNMSNNRHQDTEEKVGLLDIQPDPDQRHGPFRFPPTFPKDAEHNTSIGKPDILHQLRTEGSPQNANLFQTAIFARNSDMQGAGDFSFANIPGGVGKDRLMRNTPFDTPLTPQLIGAMLQEQKEKAGKQTDLEGMHASRATEQGFTGGMALSTLHGGGLVSQTDATELLTLGGKLTADFKREPNGDSVDRSNLVVMIRGRPERRTNTGEPREASTPPDSGRHSRLQSMDENPNLDNQPSLPLPRILEEQSQTNIRPEGVRHKGISLTRANQKVEEMFRQLEQEQSSANTPIEANTPKANELNRSVGTRRKMVGWADEAAGIVAPHENEGLGGELGKSDGSVRLHQLSNAAVDLDAEKGEARGSNRFISEQLVASHAKHTIDRDKLKLPIHRITDSVDSFSKSILAKRSLAPAVTTGNKHGGRLLAATSGQLGQPTVANDSMFGDSDIGAGFTERLSRLELLRKKLEDIVLFCEDIVKKLNQELLQKQEERNQITKVLQRATVNIPKTAPEEGDGSKESLVFIFHKDWNLVINIMIGINKAIRALWDLEQHSLMPADYKMKDMFELAYHRSLGGDLNSKQTISFICYAPYVFADIRRLYSIDDEAFLNSIGSDTLIGNLIRGEVKAFRELFSTGQSGSFFYYSVDGNYVIKTLRSDEYRFFKSILVDYHQHLRDNPKTLMPKFFGLYEILSVPKAGCCSRSCCGKGIFSWASNRIFLVVMENIFGTEMKIDRRFDLKGSTYNRTVGPQKLQGKNKSMIALKDMDFLASDSKIKLPATKIEAFRQIIEKDCKFFERMNIIDYSLLLGVHNGKMVSEQMLKKDWPYFLQEVSAHKDEVYFFGIIDILTSFSQVKKKLEYCFKRTFLGPGVSCIPAGQYSSRFQEFMKNSVFQEANPIDLLDPNPSPGLAKASQLQNKESNPGSLEFASVQPQRSASGLSGRPQPSPSVKTPKPPSQSHL